ncbi:MAG TPA: hypothetical protein VIH57_10305 [Bacteroidales bacterium]
MKRQYLLFISIFLLAMITLTSCVPGGGSHTPKNPAGFFWGIWHGWIAPVSLIWGFFENNVRIYEVYNTGWWYDLGFYISIIAGFGGISFIRKKRQKA